MPGLVHIHREGAITRLRLSNPGKLNAIDTGMWRTLQTTLQSLQALPPAQAPAVVVIEGDGDHFASGGDIAEFVAFRFEPDTLRDFHETIVAPALQALLDLDIPLVALIKGACVGGGLEIAACCDIRVAREDARFGAPIARLGFPMAPFELQTLHQRVPAAVLRDMLLAAQMYDAAEGLRLGLIHRVHPMGAFEQDAQALVQRMASLAPQAARLNKITLRQIEHGGPTPAQRHAHFAYAASEEHREGISAFLEKRAPRFDRGAP